MLRLALDPDLEGQTGGFYVNKKLKKDFISSCKTEEVLVEEKVDGLYVGHSKNYIKCYIESEKDIAGEVVKVEIVEPFEDGAKAILI
jgi:hypothetical protein